MTPLSSFAISGVTIFPAAKCLHPALRSENEDDAIDEFQLIIRHHNLKILRGHTTVDGELKCGRCHKAQHGPFEECRACCPACKTFAHKGRACPKIYATTSYWQKMGVSLDLVDYIRPAGNDLDRLIEAGVLHPMEKNDKDKQGRIRPKMTHRLCKEVYFKNRSHIAPPAPGPAPNHPDAGKVKQQAMRSSGNTNIGTPVRKPATSVATPGVKGSASTSKKATASIKQEEEDAGENEQPNPPSAARKPKHKENNAVASKSNASNGLTKMSLGHILNADTDEHEDAVEGAHDVEALATYNTENPSTTSPMHGIADDGSDSPIFEPRDDPISNIPGTGNMHSVTDNIFVPNMNFGIGGSGAHPTPSAHGMMPPPGRTDYFAGGETPASEYAYSISAYGGGFTPQPFLARATQAEEQRTETPAPVQYGQQAFNRLGASAIMPPPPSAPLAAPPAQMHAGPSPILGQSSSGLHHAGSLTTAPHQSSSQVMQPSATTDAVALLQQKMLRNEQERLHIQTSITLANVQAELANSQAEVARLQEERNNAEAEIARLNRVIFQMQNQQGANNSGGAIVGNKRPRYDDENGRRD